MYKSQLGDMIEVPDLITDKKLNLEDSIKVEQMITDQMTYTFDDQACLGSLKKISPSLEKFLKLKLKRKYSQQFQKF